MKTRKVLVEKLMARYKKSGKKAKSKLLDEFIALSGYNRCYARRVLRLGHKELNDPYRFLEVFPVHKGRKKKYTQKVLDALKKIWGILNFPCGKRLVPFLPEILRVLDRCGELRPTKDVGEDLKGISPATVDRLLRPERKKLELKGRSGTKPGSLLKHKIPIRTFADWDNAKPGFFQIDLVGHEGGNAEGDFCQTLDATDVATGWTEPVAVKNKAQVWVFEALQDMQKRLPFPMLGINSDSGSEFINAHLFAYCNSNHITFTRGRAGHKNDNCYIEQKNYTVVRQIVGYYRYDTQEELVLLNKLYRVSRLYGNFFQPQMKLLEKIRIGSKVKKKYDKSRTPYARALDSKFVSKEIKENLKKQYASLNPVTLRRDMLAMQEQLYKLAAAKHEVWKGKQLTQELPTYAKVS